MVAALPQLHHGVEEVGDTRSSTTTSSSRTSFGQEGEILFQNGTVIFLLDVGQLHLNATMAKARQLILLKNISNDLHNVCVCSTRSHAYLNDSLLLRGEVLFHVLLQSSQHHGLQNALEFLNLSHKEGVNFSVEITKVETKKKKGGWEGCHLTCSSVLRSPNSVINVCSDGNRSGSRKFSKLKSSSTVFWRGVPVNRTLCSCKLREESEEHTNSVRIWRIFLEKAYF